MGRGTSLASRNSTSWERWQGESQPGQGAQPEEKRARGLTAVLTQVKEREGKKIRMGITLAIQYLRQREEVYELAKQEVAIGVIRG